MFAAAQRRYVALTEKLVARAGAAGAPIADVAQTALLLHLANVSYLIDAFSRAPKVAPEVALDTIVEVWSGALRLRSG